METRVERLRRRYPRVLITVVLVATLLNLATLPFVRVRVRPIWRHEGGDLVTLIQTDDQTTAWRYGIYGELGRLARGGVIVVPEGSWFDPYVARNLAGVTVEEAAFDATLELPPGLSAHGLLQLIEGDDRTMLSYWVIPGPVTDRYWLGEVTGGFALVPSTVHPVPGDPDG